MNTPQTCPQCGTAAPIVLRFRVGKKFNAATMQCTNHNCAHVWGVKEPK